jgi:shikimate kinase
VTHHVVLVGLMGAGKTTVGRALARHLDRAFIDADAALVEITDRPITEIFATEGEDGFRAIEADVRGVLREHHAPAGIATRGGVVLREGNRRRLEAPEVTVVWLDAGPAFLASRVEGRSHRPLLAGDEPARDVLARLRSERGPLYAEVADIVVDVEPFHHETEKPRRALTERIAEQVLAHEAGVHGSGARP